MNMKMNKYFVAELTRKGWRRISRKFTDLKEAQNRHQYLKRKFPNACVVVDTSQ
jgi:hypothetical protein